jgi:hypothetical protein
VAAQSTPAAAAAAFAALRLLLIRSLPAASFLPFPSAARIKAHELRGKSKQELLAQVRLGGSSGGLGGGVSLLLLILCFRFAALAATHVSSSLSHTRHLNNHSSPT